MSVLVADRFQVRLEGLSDFTARRLVRLWDAVIAAGGGEDQWVRAARPMLTAAASSAIDLSLLYAELAHPTAAVGAVSPLIVADAGARVHEPLLVVNQALGAGSDWAEATTLARTSVESLGSDVVMGPGRQALADRMPTATRWVRRLNSGACDWCLSLSGVVWPAAHSASFGHSNCKCVPTPISDVGDHNDRARAAVGWDDQAARTYKNREQIARLRDSERLAMDRSRSAAREALTETDPARLERLSIREQDWETRAERAAERRRILETGTHRLAA